MEIYNLTYIQFLSLPDEYRNEMQEVYMCIKHSEIDCQTWTWGKVKQAQDLLNSELTYLDILEVAKIEGVKLKETSPAHLVFATFLGVQKSIAEITQLENEQWTTALTPKQEQAINDVGGFGMFGTLPQTLRLAEILRLNYNEVLNVAWEIGFASYTYDVRSNEYNKIILKQT